MTDSSRFHSCSGRCVHGIKGARKVQSEVTMSDCKEGIQTNGLKIRPAIFPRGIEALMNNPPLLASRSEFFKPVMSRLARKVSSIVAQSCKFKEME